MKDAVSGDSQTFLRGGNSQDQILAKGGLSQIPLFSIIVPHLPKKTLGTRHPQRSDSRPHWSRLHQLIRTALPGRSPPVGTDPTRATHSTLSRRKLFPPGNTDVLAALAD
jgi:hypothetical protein